MKRTKEELKTYFETGDVPTESQFSDLIDSIAHVDDVSNFLTEAITIDYASLAQLVANNELIIGKNYLISDYQTQYFIEGSNSSPVVEEKVIDNYISGWAVLDNDYEYDLNFGDTVEITALPEGYDGALSVGDTTTVTEVGSDYYFRFANGMQTVLGLKLKFTKSRYTSIADSALVNDSNNKPVIKPNGLINTEVHDGTPYMSMTAAENSTVPVEEIIIKAKTTNSFEEKGVSNTYDGDIIYYDFNDTEIKNDNGEVIGTRKGYINRRLNITLDIDARIDWRVYKSRRWLLDTTSITNFINANEDVTTRAGFDGKHLFTSKNRTTDDKEAFFIARLPEGKFMNVDSNGMKKEFDYTIEGVAHARDYTVFTIDENRNPVDVKKFVVDGDISNTVILGLRGEFHYNLDVDVIGSMSNNTFVSNIACRNQNTITFSDVTALDTVEIFRGSNTLFSNVQILSFMDAYTIMASSIQDTIFGTVNSNISNNPTPYPVTSWIKITSIINAEVRDSVIGSRTNYINIIDSKVVLSSLFFYYSPSATSEDGTYGREVTNINNSIFSRVGLRMTSNLDRVNMSDIFFPDKNSSDPSELFLYDITTPLTIVNIKKNKYNHKLYYMDVDADNQIQIVDL